MNIKPIAITLLGVNPQLARTYLAHEIIKDAENAGFTIDSVVRNNPSAFITLIAGFNSERPLSLSGFYGGDSTSLEQVLNMLKGYKVTQDELFFATTPSGIQEFFEALQKLKNQPFETQFEGIKVTITPEKIDLNFSELLARVTAKAEAVQKERFKKRS